MGVFSAILIYTSAILGLKQQMLWCKARSVLDLNMQDRNKTQGIPGSGAEEQCVWNTFLKISEHL